MERLGSTREETFFVGDRMNTDIRAGVEAQVDTVLVLSGVTSPGDIDKFSFRPAIILNGVGDILGVLGVVLKDLPEMKSADAGADAKAKL